MSTQANRYIREVLHQTEIPPPIDARFFYTSPLAIDDPLSPLPPPATGTPAQSKRPPRPFSVYDNTALDKAWLELRRKLLKYNEERGEKSDFEEAPKASTRSPIPIRDSKGGKERAGKGQAIGDGKRKSGGEQSGGLQSASRRAAEGSEPGERTLRGPKSVINRESQGGRIRPDEDDVDDEALQDVSRLSASQRTYDSAEPGSGSEHPDTTGTPFIRAPSRTKLVSSNQRGFIGTKDRPQMREFDSYKWDDEDFVSDDDKQSKPVVTSGPSTKVAVGVSRLHNVVMPDLQMEPIYWLPVNDVAAVLRGTWFYKDVMLPVEPDVANMLEAGYVLLQVWTETWKDELNSAAEVGAIGEMKILHKLWPERPRKQSESRPGTSSDAAAGLLQSVAETEPKTPEEERKATVEVACDVIDIATGPKGQDNKAAGKASYGRDGQIRPYPNAGIMYADEKDAYILRSSLQPSSYYGRRPLANYIRKGRKIGIQVTRGFDQEIWDRLHPPKKDSTATKAQAGVPSSQSGAPPNRRQKSDPTLALSERPKVTDLVLVIHGIGQKLSERIESYHFTHAINSFRREVNVELGTSSVKANLRKDMGGIMVLPVNWRSSLSFEEGGYRDGPEDPASNQYSLKDITPDTLPSVRNIISDVMLDIPYYLSHHQPKMIAAVIQEANRIYTLWCQNNPDFPETGRVHLIAHSLGSVMALDILSRQPTHIHQHLKRPTNVNPSQSAAPLRHFIFDTKSLFLCGSPAGFFLLLKRASLLPRSGQHKPGTDASDHRGVAGEQHTYGCLAVDNVYNIINPYDPVAYRLNATVDVNYATTLRTAHVPSVNAGWFSNPFGRLGAGSLAAAEGAVGIKPALGRLPSNVEMETHNFTREEIAEERAYLLNDNDQIDFFLRYGGGPLEIQYLTMLGAHSSYWISKDFVRLIVVETGRAEGRQGTLMSMRAVKKKAQIS